MRRALLRSICLAVLLAAARAEILDRIAVSIGNRVITESELEDEIRITAFLNGGQPDLRPENKRQTAERMVDQTLVRAEMEASRYQLPTAAEAEAVLREQQARFPDAAAYRRALAAYGISEDDLKARLLWQLTLVRFIDVRFRPGIQISAGEIQNYFNAHRNGLALSLDDYRDQIEQTLIGEAANQQVEQWLKQVRQRTRITYHEEAFP